MTNVYVIIDWMNQDLVGVYATKKALNKHWKGLDREMLEELSVIRERLIK